MLEQPGPVNGVAVAAPTLGQTVSEKLRVPVPRGSRLHVPRYSLDEMAVTVEYFRAVGHIAGEDAARAACSTCTACIVGVRMCGVGR